MDRQTISSSQLYDELAEDKLEWSQAIDDIHREFGEQGVRDILRSLQNHVLDKGITLSEATLNTAYINTIHAIDQPAYPGEIGMEKRIENIIRWNAMAMVLQAQDQGTGVGGHIATLPRLPPPWKWVLIIFSKLKLRTMAAIWCCPSPMLRRVFTPGLFLRGA